MCMYVCVLSLFHFEYVFTLEPRSFWLSLKKFNKPSIRVLRVKRYCVGESKRRSMVRGWRYNLIRFQKMYLKLVTEDCTWINNDNPRLLKEKLSCSLPRRRLCRGTTVKREEVGLNIVILYVYGLWYWIRIHKCRNHLDFETREVNVYGELRTIRPSWFSHVYSYYVFTMSCTNRRSVRTHS